MHTKPLIGVNSDYRSANKDRPAYSVVCAGYFDSILQAGGVPVIVPPLSDADDINAVLDKLEGFLMKNLFVEYSTSIGVKYHFD